MSLKVTYLNVSYIFVLKVKKTSKKTKSLFAALKPVLMRFYITQKKILCHITVGGFYSKSFVTIECCISKL